MSLDLSALVNYAVSTANAGRNRPPKWTAQEDTFICSHLGYLTDEQMGEALGRSAVAVHLRWDRDLALPGPSKAVDVVTAHQAARMLGIDGHKTAFWVDMGLLPGRIMAGGRNIRLIDRQTFRCWVLNPMNWPYFKIENVVDPELKHMLELRAARWGDEWWTTRQVADYHGVDPKDVERYIKKLGRLHSFHLPVSLGGRAHDRGWSNHFVLRSEAIAVKFFKRGKGNFERSQFTPAADAWLLKARDELGMTFVAIGRTMKIGAEKQNPKTGTASSNPTISYRYHLLKAIQKKTKRRAKQ
jgi:hypothetical protein